MKNIRNNLVGISAGVGALFLSPAIALAQFNMVPDSATTLNKISIYTLISGLVSLVLVVAALAFFFTLVIGGIQWILAGGDKANAESARKKITGALIGLAIVFIAWAIGSLINILFGFNIFNLTIPILYNNVP